MANNNGKEVYFIGEKKIKEFEEQIAAARSELGYIEMVELWILHFAPNVLFERVETPNYCGLKIFSSKSRALNVEISFSI